MARRLAYLLFIFAVCCFSISVNQELAQAAGWQDYTLNLEDGYSIVRANSLEIMLLHKGNIIISPHQFPGIGPITRYSQEDSIIFVETNEAKEQSKVDSRKKYYFIVSIDESGAPETIGPLSDAEFGSHVIARQYSPINWRRPQNPKFLLPLMGSVMTLIILLPILLVVHAKIAIPLILVLAWVLFYLLKKRRLYKHGTGSMRSLSEKN